MKEIIKQRIEKYKKDLLDIKKEIDINEENCFSKEYKEKDYELKILYYTYEGIINELQSLEINKNILENGF